MSDSKKKDTTDHTTVQGPKQGLYEFTSFETDMVIKRRP
jgi:hypothetical protein